MSGTDGSTQPPSRGESGANVEIGARLYGSINAELKVRIQSSSAGSQYKPEFAPQVAGLGCHFEVVEPPRRRGSAQAIGMTGACFRSRNGACSRSGCCMFPLPGVHCGFLMRVPDTGMRHPSQSVKSLLWLR